MTSLYSIVYLLFSFILLVYGISNKKSRLNLFSYSLALNIFPLFFMPSISMGEARIIGIPFGYLPMIAAGVVLFFSYGVKVNDRNKIIVFLMVLFLAYTIIISFIKGITLSAFIYWLMWVFNFMLFIVTVNIFSKVNIGKSISIIKKIFLILFYGSIVGIFRYVVGLDEGSNFMPMFNRNATVVMVVMLTPLIFFLREYKAIKNTFFWFAYIAIFLCLLLMHSRSGFLGFLLLSFLYLLLSGKIQVGKIVVIVILLFSFLFSPLGEKINSRLLAAFDSSMILSSGNQIEKGESDYKRNMLMLSAVEIIKNDFWFGAGVGIDNYQKAFHKYVHFYHHDSKAHNFYLSYMAELGFFGFTLLMIILLLIYKKLSKKTNMIAFRVSFFGLAFMMTMNEYIGLPEIWFFLGILVGISTAKPAVVTWETVKCRVPCDDRN